MNPQLMSKRSVLEQQQQPVDHGQLSALRKITRQHEVAVDGEELERPKPWR